MSKKKTSIEEEMKECTFYVEGMHCAACELLIEKTLIKEKGVKSVEASQGKKIVTVVCDKDSKLGIDKLNKSFNDRGYSFSENEYKHPSLISMNRNGSINIDIEKARHLLYGLVIVVLIVVAFLALQSSGVAGWVSLNSNSNIVAYVLYGIIAGASGCAALVGGAILSMSKQWNEKYKDSTSGLGKFQPHFMFHIGRVISFIVLGGILGLIGKVVEEQIQSYTLYMTLIISIIMFILGLGMLGVKWASRIKLSTPKFVGRYVADEKNFKKSNLLPGIMGLLSFLLPCGMTLSAMMATLSSNSDIVGSLTAFKVGALNMLAFVIGTLVFLVPISISSVKFNSKPHFTRRFNLIAGILVLLFAVSGFDAFLVGKGSKYSISALFLKSSSEVVTVEDGIQIIKMDALAGKYSPNSFKVRVGIPVRWEVTNRGVSGCSWEIISEGLLGERSIPLQDTAMGETVSIEFTPKETGKFTFSCWMGMIPGMIEVVEQDEDTSQEAVEDLNVPSQGSGGGCGGGCDGSCGGGCGNPGCSATQ